MSDEQTRRQLQEALDAQLEPERYEKLMQDVRADRETAAEYSRLQSVDSMLRDATPEPAPVSLADTIMARIAQPETLPQPVRTARSLAIGLGVVALVVLPLLTGLSLWVIRTLGTGAGISGMAMGIVGFAALLYAGLAGLIGFAQGLVENRPWMLVLLAAIPLAWFGLSRLGRQWMEAE